jgi:hypothetical protein
MADNSLPMIQVEGPARFYVGAQNCVATEYADYTGMTFLGVAENGAQISVSGNVHQVYSDDNGGSSGVAAEILWMGATASVRGTLVKFNGTAANSVINGAYATSTDVGIVVQLPGTPLFAGGFGFGVWIVGSQKTYYFPKCELASQPRDFEISTREKKVSFTFNAHPVYAGNSGRLYFTGSGGGLYEPADCNGYGGSVPTNWGA